MRGSSFCQRLCVGALLRSLHKQAWLSFGFVEKCDRSFFTKYSGLAPFVVFFFFCFLLTVMVAICSRTVVVGKEHPNARRISCGVQHRVVACLQKLFTADYLLHFLRVQTRVVVSRL